MRVTVRFFAMIRDAIGVESLVIDLPTGAIAADAIEAVAIKYPSIRPYSKRLAVALNLQYVPLDQSLKDGDELALIPPVSGG